MTAGRYRYGQLPFPSPLYLRPPRLPHFPHLQCCPSPLGQGTRPQRVLAPFPPHPGSHTFHTCSAALALSTRGRGRSGSLPSGRNHAASVPPAYNSSTRRLDIYHDPRQEGPSAVRPQCVMLGPLSPVMYSLSSQKVLSVGRRQAPRKGTTLGWRSCETGGARCRGLVGLMQAGGSGGADA